MFFFLLLINVFKIDLDYQYQSMINLNSLRDLELNINQSEDMIGLQLIF